MSLPRVLVCSARERKCHANVGIIFSSSHRDDLRRPGGSQSVAAPMSPSRLATSEPPRAMKWFLVRGANNCGSVLALAPSSGSMYFITGSSKKALASTLDCERMSARATGRSSISATGDVVLQRALLAFQLLHPLLDDVADADDADKALVLHDWDVPD